MIDNQELFKRLRVLRGLSWDALVREVGRPKGSITAWASGTKGAGIERDVLAWIERQAAHLIEEARRLEAQPTRSCFRNGVGNMTPPRPPAVPFDPRDLEPVPATAEDARDWLYEEWLRRGLKHEAIQERLAQFSEAGVLREANLMRLRHGLPPYLPPRRAPERPFA